MFLRFLRIRCYISGSIIDFWKINTLMPLTLPLTAMFILVFSLHKVTCEFKIKVIYDLTPWDGGPRHLPTNRKPSTTGIGFSAEF